MELNIAIVCRHNMYERLAAPFANYPNVKVSCALSTWGDLANHLQTTMVHGLVVEEGISLHEQTRTFPYPQLVYSGSTKKYQQQVAEWIETLQLELGDIHSPHVTDEVEEEKEEIPISSIPEGKKVFVCSGDRGFFQGIQQFPGIYVLDGVDSIESLYPRMKERRDNGDIMPEMVLIEESSVRLPTDPLREQVIWETIEEIREFHVEIAILLFARDNRIFTTKLIENEIFNFTAKDNLTYDDMQKLLFTKMSKVDVIEYYEPVIPQKEKKLKLNPFSRSAQELDNSLKMIEKGGEGEVIEEKVNNEEIPEEKVPERVTEPAKKKMPTPIKPKLGSMFTGRKNEENKREEEEKLKVVSPKQPSKKRLGTLHFSLFGKKERVGEERQEPVLTISQAVPHRLLVYSPKGGAGATSLAVYMAESSPTGTVGVVEIAYSYSQLSGRQKLQVEYNIDTIQDGMEEFAVCENKYLVAPWIFPAKKTFTDSLMMNWLTKAERAFPGRLIIADLQSQTLPIPLMRAHGWATKVIWMVQNTEDHFGMVDIQLSKLRAAGAEWNKIGLIIQDITGEKLPWNEIGLDILLETEEFPGSRQWEQEVSEATYQHLGISGLSSGRRVVLGRQR
ncbi:hypothetical protein [Aneurinibacillus thermoaerophilus]|uniref:hypothetical protein n=1 Tax=Aneurinibacillus thermoaerophilus TaxID=143495 RepID=UPI002E2286E1|nr:hypothetical protein [Aneurinibacillus thermoaerophilus]